jgi:hypothetical protein
MNVLSEEDITKIMASQLYEEASDAIKLQFWIQVSKSFTVGTWVDGKKVTMKISTQAIRTLKKKGLLTPVEAKK